MIQKTYLFSFSRQRVLIKTFQEKFQIISLDEPKWVEWFHQAPWKSTLLFSSLSLSLSVTFVYFFNATRLVLYTPSSSATSTKVCRINRSSISRKRDKFNVQSLVSKIQLFFSVSVLVVQHGWRACLFIKKLAPHVSPIFSLSLLQPSCVLYLCQMSGTYPHTHWLSILSD